MFEPGANAFLTLHELSRSATAVRGFVVSCGSGNPQVRQKDVRLAWSVGVEFAWPSSWCHHLEHVADLQAPHRGGRTAAGQAQQPCRLAHGRGESPRRPEDGEGRRRGRAAQDGGRFGPGPLSGDAAGRQRSGCAPVFHPGRGDAARSGCSPPPAAVGALTSPRARLKVVPCALLRG